MKILVFSDSHGSPSYIRTALRQHGGQADALLFLGDGVLDAVTVFSEYPDILSYTVRGNCDSALRLAAGGIDAPEEEVISLGGECKEVNIYIDGRHSGSQETFFE